MGVASAAHGVAHRRAGVFARAVGGALAGRRAGVGPHAARPARAQGAEQHDVAGRQAFEHLGRFERAQAQAQPARFDAAVARDAAPWRAPPSCSPASASIGTTSARSRRPVSTSTDSVMSSRRKAGGACGSDELDLDRAALRVDQRRDRQHARGEALARERHRRARWPAGRPAAARGSARPPGPPAAAAPASARVSSARPGCTIWPGSTARTSTRASAGAVSTACSSRACAAATAARASASCACACATSVPCSALAARCALRAGLLRLRHVDGAARLVEPRLAEEAARHQILRALQFGLRRQQHRLGLRHAGLRRAAPGAAQPGQPRRGLALAGLRLLEGGAQLVALQPDQHVAAAHLRALVHRHLEHAAGERAAHVDARRRGHARREQQRAHQRRRLHRHRRRRSARADTTPPAAAASSGGEGGEREDRAT